MMPTPETDSILTLPSVRPSTRAWTLLELMIIVAIILILVSIGAVQFQRAVELAERTKTEQNLRTIMHAVESYWVQHGSYPATLDDVEGIPRSDPWGEPFQYTNHSLVTKGELRKDRNLVPINSNYDLWSKGPDRMTAYPLTAKASLDDYIVANDGRFIGLAADY